MVLDERDNGAFEIREREKRQSSQSGRLTNDGQKESPQPISLDNEIRRIIFPVHFEKSPIMVDQVARPFPLDLLDHCDPIHGNW
jgi:hypothetical protein